MKNTSDVVPLVVSTQWQITVCELPNLQKLLLIYKIKRRKRQILGIILGHCGKTMHMVYLPTDEKESVSSCYGPGVIKAKGNKTIKQHRSLQPLKPFWCGSDRGNVRGIVLESLKSRDSLKKTTLQFPKEDVVGNLYHYILE